MASAVAAVLPEDLLLPSYSSSPYGWLSPRISFSRDLPEGDKPAPDEVPSEAAEARDCVDFEFLLDDPVAMLSADELFSDGKLVPLQPASVLSAAMESMEPVNADDVRPLELLTSQRRAEISGSDPFVFSAKARRCSSWWRQLLGLKRSEPDPKSSGDSGSTAAAVKTNPSTRSLKRFLHRNLRSAANDSSLILPLLRDSDPDPISVSSHGSLSSSSASPVPDHDDLTRFSLDSSKQARTPISAARAPLRVWLAQRRRDHVQARIRRGPVRAAAPEPTRRASVARPRMNSSGKVVFLSLERSSSSPGSFHGGPRPRPRPRGIERSYSASFGVAPVLNVPVYTVCGSAKSVSVFGLGPLFSQHRKERDGGVAGATAGGRTRCKGKTDKALPVAAD